MKKRPKVIRKWPIELTWFVPGVGEFFHFTWGLERKQPMYMGHYHIFFLLQG